MKKLLIINGPNLNMLGKRPAEIYGSKSLQDILDMASSYAKPLGIELSSVQSNSEGDLVDYIQQAVGVYGGIIINPGAYSHTSIAIRDAIESINIPVIEVHLSNIYKREEYRRKSYVSEVATGVISGLGANGYILAVSALEEILSNS
jgi:3-dehydroquinate dehydratase-2